MLTNKKALIVGIDSFTGQHLSSYLRKYGYSVYGTSMNLNHCTDSIYRCDITKKEQISKVIETVRPDYVIHLAGISFVEHSKALDFYRVNSIGAMNLLDSCLDVGHQPDKIIITSSAAVYGNQEVESLNESLCCHPVGHYGASKYTMECLATEYFSKLNILIARPFNYTGIGQSIDFLIPKIVQHYKNGADVIELGNIDVVREFNDVSFACEAYIGLAKCSAISEIVNIASGRGISIKDIVQDMQQIAQQDIRISINQSLVRKNEIRILVGSPEKLFSLTGKIHQKPLKKTLEDMYKDIQI